MWHHTRSPGGAGSTTLPSCLLQLHAPTEHARSCPPSCKTRRVHAPGLWPPQLWYGTCLRSAPTSETKSTNGSPPTGYEPTSINPSKKKGSTRKKTSKDDSETVTKPRPPPEPPPNTPVAHRRTKSYIKHTRYCIIGGYYISGTGAWRRYQQLPGL